LNLLPPTRLKAILLALLITFIWSTSWILIKIGLKEIPALTFAGVRYTLAFLCLTPFLFQKNIREQVKKLNAKEWGLFALLGLVLYALAQGGQFLGLAYLPTVTVSLLLNLTSLFVAFSGMILLKENPTRLQWMGVGLNLTGVLIYFYPGAFQSAQWLGILFVVISLAANIGGALLGRSLNRNSTYNPLVVTIISMGFGSVIMLISGLFTQGFPSISLTGWGIIVLLAIVNTAFSFTVWNYILQTLTAMESSLINSTMLVQVAILSWIFLGERLNVLEIIGMLFAMAGVFVVQLRFSRRGK
jgi:drug/metabolite transporter (DMT)-like permease